MKEISKKLDELYDKFIDETVEPRVCKKDKIGQFVAVGKLKKPQNHFGSPVNVVTIWTVQLRDDLSIKETPTVLTFDELKIYKNCCDEIIKKWND